MTDPFRLDGKVAVITGASRGIGAATARMMARAGAKVVVSSRKLEACEAVVKEIADAGGEAFAHACNVARREDLQSLADAAVARWGGVDVLVCNAAVNPYFGPLQDIPDDAYEKIMGANLRSMVWLGNMVLPGMAARGGGSAVLVASVGGLRGSAKLGAYGISKAAVMQLARALAVEWGPRGIRVNSVAPAVIKTDFARALWDDPALEAEKTKAYPLRRFGNVEEVAAAILFLASPAGGFVTGHNLVIDGGITISGAN